MRRKRSKQNTLPVAEHQRQQQRAPLAITKYMHYSVRSPHDATPADITAKKYHWRWDRAVRAPILAFFERSLMWRQRTDFTSAAARAGARFTGAAAARVRSTLAQCGPTKTTRQARR
jgi:hypothetical protein